MSYLSSKMDERLLTAQLAISNALSDVEILESLSLFGYDEAKLTAGRTLYQEAEALANQQKVEYGEQYEATELLNARRQQANKAYIRTLKVARIALRGNTKARTALILGGTRKQSLSGWLKQVQTFYANLLADANLLTQMSKFGYDQAKLEAEQALVQAVVEADQAQQKETGEAREATKLRDAKLNEMDRWMADFINIARLALEDNTQKLAKLGI